MLIRVSLISAALVASSAATSQSQRAAAPKSISKADFTKTIDSRFAAIDSNHDGSVSKAEIEAAQAKALQELKGRQQQEIQTEFKKLDTNKDNSLSLAEFAAAARPLPAPTAEAPIAKLDTNKDGKISLAEYRAPRIADFDKIDANHDGTLTAQEVRAARRK